MTDTDRIGWASAHVQLAGGDVTLVGSLQFRNRTLTVTLDESDPVPGPIRLVDCDLAVELRSNEYSITGTTDLDPPNVVETWIVTRIPRTTGCC